MKKLKLILVIVFLILLATPAVFLNNKTNVVSVIDNRKLKEFPELNTSFLSNLNGYLSDRFGGRTQAIKTYTAMMDKLFGILVHPTYIYGKEGHVFFYMWNEEKYGDYHEKFVQSLSSINQYLSDKDVKFYVMVEPEKKSVYTQYLPDGINYNRNMILKFEENLEKNNVEVIDNTELLIEKSKEEAVYDLKYDAGHWNDLGAFYSINNLLGVVKEDFPQVNLLSKDDFDITSKVQTKLKVSDFDIYDVSPVFTLKNDSQYEEISSQYSDLKLDRNYTTFSYYRNKENSDLPKAIVFQGSYLNGREQFLKSRFSEYIAIHNYQNIFNIDEYVDQFNPDLVIFEFAEYTLSETYFSIENMKKWIK